MIKTICMCGHEESLRRLRLAFQPLGIDLENRDYQLEQDITEALEADCSIGGILVVEQTTLGLEDGKYGLIERIRALDPTVRIVFCCNSGKRDSEFENWCYKFAVYDFFYPKKDESYDIGMIAECLRQGRIPQERNAPAEPWQAQEQSAKLPGFFQRLKKAKPQKSPKPPPVPRVKKTKPPKQPRVGKSLLEAVAALRPEVPKTHSTVTTVDMKREAAWQDQRMPEPQSSQAPPLPDAVPAKQANSEASTPPTIIEQNVNTAVDTTVEKPHEEAPNQSWQYPPLTVLESGQAKVDEKSPQLSNITPITVLEQKRQKAAQEKAVQKQAPPTPEKAIVREVIREVVKEVPVEVVKEVPVEVVREVVREVPTEREVVRYRETSGTFTVAVFNLSHGAGATTMAHRLAEALSLTGAKTALLAVDGKQDLRATKCRAECYMATTYDDALSALQRYSIDNHDFMVADFGMLFDIAANGAAADDYLTEKSALIQEFFRCNLHIGMAFSGSWHGNKLRFFAENEMAQRLEYGNYTFVLDGDTRPYRHYGLELLTRSEAGPEVFVERLQAKEKPRKRGIFPF